MKNFDTKILNRIEDMQKGKCGIYPYRVAQDVAVEFRLPIHEAYEYVLQHIKCEMYAALAAR